MEGVPNLLKRMAKVIFAFVAAAGTSDCVTEQSILKMGKPCDFKSIHI